MTHEKLSMPEEIWVNRELGSFYGSDDRLHQSIKDSRTKYIRADLASPKADTEIIDKTHLANAIDDLRDWQMIGERTHAEREHKKLEARAYLKKHHKTLNALMEKEEQNAP